MFSILKIGKNANLTKNGFVTIYFVASCGPLRLENGIVSYDRDPAGDHRYPVETTGTFTCNNGYTLVFGDESTKCQASGYWDEMWSRQCRGNEIKQ